MDALHDDPAIMTGEDDFDTVMRGYNRAQVDDFVARTRAELGDLEQRLAVARRETERVRKDLAATQRELEVQRSDAKPAHAAVSERLSQILRLAAEEADQERTAAEAAIADMRAEAATSVQRLREDAAAESERTIAAAREQSNRDLKAAQDEAQSLVATSRDEAERSVATAQERAHRLVSAAERRAVAVNDIANRRLAMMDERHTETVRRLSEIRDALVGVLGEESGRPALEAEVDAVSTGEVAERPPGVNGDRVPVGGTSTSAAVALGSTADTPVAADVDSHLSGAGDLGGGEPLTSPDVTTADDFGARTVDSSGPGESAGPVKDESLQSAVRAGR